MGPALRVRLLGPFEVEGLDPVRLGSRKARTLLKMLALAGGVPLAVDRLADGLWGDAPPARPGDQVAVLVSRLRGVLGADRLPRGDAGYALRADWVDLTALRELAAEARRRLEAGGADAARVAAVAALALVRGPLLLDEPDAAWAEGARLTVERDVAALRHLAARASLAAGDAVAAATHALAALDADGHDEEALRLAMEALAACGRRAAALDLYERVRRTLAGDLGVDPAAATRAAHHALLREDGAATATLPPPAPAAPPGREAALARLASALEGTRLGLRAVVVEGEPGMGKTTLLRALAATAADAGATVLTGRCDELGRRLPLQPVLDALHLHLSGLSAGAADAVLGRDARLLRPLLGGTPPADAVEATLAPAPDEGAARLVLYTALLGVVGRLAAAAPVALLVDDVHLAGDATLEWLQHAVRRGHDLTLLLVATRTSADAGRALEGWDRLVLAPLDRGAAEALVGAEAAERLLEPTGGNPLFLTELARAPAGTVPTTILDAVGARVDALGVAATTLRGAAVLGTDVDVDLLAEVLARPAVALLDDLEAGVRLGFLEDRDGAMRFRHAIVRDALVAGTGAARRALLHREASRALSGRAGADPLRVAEHARLGGDVAVAAAALLDAGRRALARFDPAAAARLLDEALALHPTPAARLERARVRIVAGRPQAALEDAAAVLAEERTPEALELAGYAAYYARDFDAATTHAEAALARARTPGDRERCLVLLGRVHHAVGRLDDAGRALEEAAGGATGGSALAGAVLGLVRQHQGRPAAALAGLPASTMGGADHLFVPFHRHLVAALALADGGRPEAALAEATALAELVERRGVRRFAGRADNVRGWILRGLGDPELADEANALGLERAHAVGYVEAECWSRLDLAEGRLRRGDLDGGARALAELATVQAAVHAFAWRDRLRARLLDVRLRLAAGETPLEDALAVTATAERLGARKYVLLGRLAAARAAARGGERVDAETVERDLDDLDGIAAVEAWWVTGEVAAALGVDRWFDRAGRRAAALAAAAGSSGERLPGYAATVLERMSRRSGPG